MNIILLTHSREISKPSNTGKLALDALGSSARRVIWERTQPDQWLMEHIKQQPTALLFPSDDHQAETEVSLFESYIVIDSTWQEARKIYNHSPYLKELPKLSLKPVGKSKFSLRRNQLENGLCTAECVEEILKQRGQQKLASLLNERFLAFIEQSRKS